MTARLKRVNIEGDTRLDPAVWDCLLNALAKVRNRNYDSISVEVGSEMNRNRECGFGNEKRLVLNICGIKSDNVVDLSATYRGSEIRFSHYIFDVRSMKKFGWKPIYNSKKTFVVLWVKPPYVFMPVDITTLKLTRPVKDLVSFAVKEIEKLPAFVFQIDSEKAERDLNNLIRRVRRSEVHRLEKNVDECVQNISYYRDKFAELLSRLRQERQRLLVAKELVSKRTSVAGLFEKVKKIDKVKFIGIVDSKVVIITEPLEATYEHPDTKRKIKVELGSFKITWGDGSSIRIYNLDKPSDLSYDHPHIQHGDPCWGNMEEIEEFAQDFRIDVVAQMTLGYLQSINPEDWNLDAQEWSTAFKKGVGK